ncbi:MAG: ABC transporter substrate-binding protein [Armatimonadetes bacterium]|nr:ABC transporter substrate-binding protein [Armatimonadota bacterium]
MRRRKFLGLVGGAAASWPLAVRAQHPDRMRRVALLVLYAENDPQGQTRAAAFRQGLESAGWTIGRNITVDYVWGTFNPDWTNSVTKELRRLAPDVVVVNSSTALDAIQSAAAATPIVFVAVSEPVAQGFVASLSHPGGNMTGLTNLEPSMGGKWIGLLKEIAPQVKKIAFLYNPGNPGSRVTFQTAQSAAKAFSLDLADRPVSQPSDVEAVMTALGGEPNGAVIVPPDPLTVGFRKQILDLASSYKLPVVSAIRSFADEGGLLAYGVHIPDLFRQAGGYVDRILKGSKPGDIPVAQPVKFVLIINLKTAKALGLTVPAALLATADELIE